MSSQEKVRIRNPIQLRNKNLKFKLSKKIIRGVPKSRNLPRNIIQLSNNLGYTLKAETVPGILHWVSSIFIYIFLSKFWT